jgi:methylenetetrahydrofolate dehydrogenase (NADP+)/methenyltetrahydrofolate cyclohydrolase
MILLDGKLVAQTMQADIKAQVADIQLSGKRVPHLVAIIVGNDIASQTYVRNKIITCEALGMKSTEYALPTETSEANLLKLINQLNNNQDVDGILVQLPLPKHINEKNILEAVDYQKDVDGFHPINLGRLAKGEEAVFAATPYGITKLIEHYKIETAGKHCVIVGRSNIVGTPMALLMSKNYPFGNATVTICHSKTNDLAFFTKQADILIVAVGQSEIIKKDMVKEGAVVIDVGMNSKEDSSKKSGYKLCGDVDFEGVSEVASYITPVPGGVGPMTITALMLNTLTTYKRRLNNGN